MNEDENGKIKKYWKIGENAEYWKPLGVTKALRTRISASAVRSRTSLLAADGSSSSLSDVILWMGYFYTVTLCAGCLWIFTGTYTCMWCSFVTLTRLYKFWSCAIRVHTLWWPWIVTCLRAGI
jgi:hypothetical protein